MSVPNLGKQHTCLALGNVCVGNGELCSGEDFMHCASLKIMSAFI